MSKNSKPFGKEEVRAALIAAAAELFARHGVSGVSLRDIAAQAGVNHGLIHRHFGSKAALRKEVQETLSAQVREDIGQNQDFFQAITKAALAGRENEAFWQVLARSLLDGEINGAVQDDFPFVRQAVALARQDREKGILTQDMDPRIMTAGILALGLGLQVFHAFLLPASGMDSMSEEHAREKIFLKWLSLLKAPFREKS